MDYKEKLEEAKRLYETANVDQRYVLESLFSELKESDDEKIRKEIINYIKSAIGDEDIVSPWIAWLENQGEQEFVLNHTWSEEDEKNIRGLLSICDVYSTKTSFYPKENKYIENLKNWLKSLTDRVQPKKDWSEEDAVMLNDCICAINAANEVDYSISEKERLTNFLNSLRPQKQWKPTSEQMDALNDVISSRDIKYDILSELWKNLKKLKGE